MLFYLLDPLHYSSS